ILVLHPRPVEREWLAGLLWPDSPQDAALFYLRRSLSELRRALGSEAGRLVAESTRTIRLDLACACIDVLAFDEAILCAEPSSLKLAVELYRGRLLPSIDLEWLESERESRHERYLGALERLAAAASDSGDSHSAITYFRCA